MRRPPELLPVAVAAAGGLALAIGLVAVLNGVLIGAAVAVGGAALLAWSVFSRRA